MKRARTRFDGARSLICAAALAWTAVCARGGVTPSFYVGNVQPVRDEYGRMMPGSRLSAEAAARPLVEVRTATDGIIRPPSTNGAAHPYNPLLSAESVGGMGMNAARSDSGVFCMVFPSPPAHGAKIFARAYNAPTAAAASFYADSAVCLVSTNRSSLTVTFGAAKPLDSGDADADGLNNSWEESMGTADRATADYDGDGMSDLFEMLAGTSATDPGSLLAFQTIRRDEEGAVPRGEGEPDLRPVTMRWQSVPGRRYQLQFVPSLVGEQVFIPVGDVITAGEGETSIEKLVEVSADSVAGTFRVKLVHD